MNTIDRVKNILVAPRTEWPRIKEEPATVASLYVGYILILAAIGPIALVLRAPSTIGLAIVSYVISLAMAYLLALVVDALAPTFGGEKAFVQSLKLVAYAYTAIWIGGIFRLLPWIGGLLILLSAVYSIYTFYLGAPVLRKASAEKAAGFTIVVVICAIVLGVVATRILLALLFGGALLGTIGGIG